MESTDENEISHWEVTSEIVVNKEDSNQNCEDGELWSYFDNQNEEFKTVSCKSCEAVLSYKSLSVLTEHLTEHGITIQDHDETEAVFLDSDLEESTIASSKKSAAWNYFKVKDSKVKIAQCCLCGTCCSYRSSVSNLMKHIARKHKGVLKEEQRERVKKEYLNGHIPSAVWNYFDAINQAEKVAVCLVCDRTICYSTGNANLFRHLKRHPEVKLPNPQFKLLNLKEECYTKEGDDDSQDMEMDTVYLEDFDENFDKLDPVPAMKKIKKSHNNSDEGTSSKQEDSLDCFGKYVVSLLRLLPKQKCNILQAEFINRIMDEM